MSGKAYTMREMKSIVEYINERKAFGEVKGRKLWVDFANTPLTIRTWQSLKETFLKRILPDIHNPYYKLTTDQIRSFKEGCDVEAREKNKLEIVNLDDDSSSNSHAENQVDKEQPSTSHANNGGATTGENITSSKVESRDRDSVDTVIIPTCYETAEDIQKALESPTSDHSSQNTLNSPKEDVQEKPTPTKSFRDLITYSEPLTPMLQDVLNDFADEDSDSDADIRMEIVEAVHDTEPQEDKQESAIEILDSEQQVLNETAPIEVLDSEELITKDKTVQEDNPENPDFAQPKVSSLKLKKRKDRYRIESPKPMETTEQNGNTKINGNIPTEPGKSSVPSESVENGSEITSTNQTKIDEKKDKPLVTVLQKSQNLSNSADTILPNNQEAFNNSGNNGKPTEKLTSETVKKINDDNTKNKTRKRANSQDIAPNNKIKKNMVNSKSTKAMSDTDTIKKNLSKNANVETNFINKNKESKLALNDTAKKIDEEPNNHAENEPSTNKEESNALSQPSQLNPCLKSVSLFAEQFNRDSYLESESEQQPDTSKSKDVDNKKTDGNASNMNQVVILRSHSESESGNNEVSPEASNVPKSRVTKSQREKALANVFGFSTGGVTKKRKKSVSHRKLSTHRIPSASNGESSEWTSESESDAYVSPPRGRRNRQARKYLKPKSARILSLEEEGGLFVMYNKKIYPLVKDGKIIKNYLTYLPESDPEEEESYWKLKYAEEKKRVDELKKLIDQNQAKPLKEKSPILQSKSSRTIYYNKSPAKTAPNKIKDVETLNVPRKESSSEEQDTKGKTLKITFAKNNQEVHVEGHWSNIHPVLAEVVQIFNKDTDAPKALKPNGNTDATEIISSTSSEKSVAVTPVDKETREKVDKMETEIFNEIEKRDQEEQVVVKELKSVSSQTKGNPRLRRSRIKRTASNQSVGPTSSASSSHSPKRQKTDADEEKTVQKDIPTVDEKPANENSAKSQKSVGKKASKTGQKNAGNKNNNKATDQKTEQKVAEPTEEKTAKESKEAPAIETSRVTTRRQTRTPKKDDKEETPAKSTRISRRSKTAVPEAVSSAKVDEEDDVRYMFPPAKKPAKATKATLSLNKTRDSKRSAEAPQIYISPDLSLHSESTQGYQDSDNSPPKPMVRRKRKLSVSTAMTKIKHRSSRSKRKSYPIITGDFSSDSNSSFHIVVRPVNENSSLKSEAYKTDSYQLLFPQSRNLLKPLEKIDEDSPLENDIQSDASQNTLNILNTFKQTLNIDVNIDYGSSSNGNSSNVSLPLSPELSIVENLSISKEMLNSIENHPTLNEIQANNIMDEETRNQYLISQVDVSMPLMQQQCNFRQSFPRDITAEQTIDHTNRAVISDSFLNKINTVNIEDAPSLSESLDTRLKNLLLESARKMSVASIELNDINNNGNADAQRKSKSGKRCSTPRKRKEAQKKKPKIADPVVEEEFTESCSYGGRKSCPPAILINEENIFFKENIDVNTDIDTNVNEKAKGRKKKDVIRVKILRPKSKSRKNAEHPTETRDTSIQNIHDSGINETESNLSIQGFNDSVDLIHNHSETCLHANECMADSVEFIETTSRSIISLNNTESLSSDDRGFQKQIEFRDCQEFFCQNAQDRGNVNCVQKPKAEREETVYHSLLSDTSLITEDLSDEPPSSQASKWYLLSEDETQTANNIVTRTSSNFGSNLRQIFPITCAVPDLSTITERSDESRKPTLDSDVSTRQDFDSQSMFDNMNCK